MADMHTKHSACRDQAKTRRTGLWLAIAIGFLALAMRLFCINATVVDSPVRGDAVSYHAYAYNIAHHGIFSRAKPGAKKIIPDSYRDPGYPALMAATMRISGTEAGWYPLLLNTQAILGSLAVLFMILVGRQWLRTPWLVAAGILMALWPHSITMSGYLLTETLTGFLACLGLFLVSVAQGRRWPLWAAAGLVFGLASLTNAILLPVGVLLAVALLWARRASRTAALALIVGFLLLPGAWALRGTLIDAGGGKALTTTSSGRAIQNLVQGAWPEYHDAWRMSIQGNENARRKMAEIEGEYVLMSRDLRSGGAKVLSRLAADPIRYAAWYASKPMLLWGWDIRIGVGDVFVYPVKSSPYRSNPAFWLMGALAKAINPWLFVLAMVACLMVLSIRRQATTGRVACMVLVAYVTAAYGALQSEPRYSIPFRPAEILLAMWMLQALVSAATGWMRSGRSDRAGQITQAAE